MVLRRRRDEGWDGRERRDPATVLVVNDEQDACEMLVRFLNHAGFDTVGANADLEAMSEIYNKLPRCVVLDLAAGGVGSSLKILDQIRSSEDLRVRNARVVLCASSPRNRSFSFQSGTDGFLVRPFYLDDLIEQVTDVLRRPQDERSRHRRDELARHGD